MLNYGIRYEYTPLFTPPAPFTKPTAAFAADYSTTPTGPVNTSLQGWEQVMHCGPVRGKSILSAASATR